MAQAIALEICHRRYGGIIHPRPCGAACSLLQAGRKSGRSDPQIPAWSESVIDPPTIEKVRSPPHAIVKVPLIGAVPLSHTSRSANARTNCCSNSCASASIAGYRAADGATGCAARCAAQWSRRGRTRTRSLASISRTPVRFGLGQSGAARGDNRYGHKNQPCNRKYCPQHMSLPILWRLP